MESADDRKAVHEKQLEQDSRGQLAESFNESIKQTKESFIKERGLRNLVSVSEPLDRAMQQLADTIDEIDTNIGQEQLDERLAAETKAVSTNRNCEFACTLTFSAVSCSALLNTNF